MCNFKNRIRLQMTAIVASIAICIGARFPTACAQDREYYDNLSFGHPDEILKLEPGVYQSLPSVFLVHTSRSSRIECPESVAVDFAKLKAETASFRQQYSFATSIPDDNLRWIQVANDPDRFLKASAKTKVLELTKHDVETGSCYAVDRNGILLTNRHVVASEQAKSMEFREIMSYEPPPLIEMVKNLKAGIGEWTGSRNDETFLEANLFGWFAARSKLSTKVFGVKVAVAYSAKNWFEQQANPTADSIAAGLFGIHVRVPKLLPATVIAMGSEDHANDIAILKIDGNVSDALICLDLARPGAIRVKSRVYTLGFPGYRYDFANLKPRDFMSVTLQGGDVVRMPKENGLNLAERFKVNLLGIRGAEDLLFVSAYMNHGGSGGPVILANGSVAGMTVCGLHLPPEELEAESPGKQSATPNGSFKPTISGVQIQAGDFREAIRASVQELIKQSRDQNMAVPLERLLAFLHQNGIHPDPGPATKEWREALAHYRRGEYREAASKLESVSNRQIHFPRPVQAFKLQPTSITSHYVAELRDAAKYKAGNKP